MEKNYFLAKLIPPRPSFTADMTTEERQVMMDHGAYLGKYVDSGTVIVMGPAHGALRFSRPVLNRRSGPSSPAIPPFSPGSVSDGRFTRCCKRLSGTSAGSHAPVQAAPPEISVGENPSEKGKGC